jgi:hypothetical protein
MKRKDGGSNFRSLINYIVGDRGERKETNRALYVGTRNTFSDISENYWGVALEMNGLGMSNVRIKDPVYHFVLSFRPDETPTKVQVDEAVDIALQALELSGCKALYALQTDNGIHHIHICVCRVDPDTGRAINPGNGWDKKALREAANVIELRQGWKLTGNDGRAGSKPHAGKADKDPPPLKTRARDLEAHMGEKSAQTLAIEQAAGLIRESRDWKELHERLRSAGFAYRKKGSGAVIDVNGIFVKASDAGRDCALTQLEKRIGAYTEANANAESRSLPAPSESAEAERSLRAETAGSKRGPEHKKEPTKQTAVTKKTLTAWQRYQLYCEDFRDKKTCRTTIFANQKAERAELKKLHKRQRDEIFKRSWKGKGKLLNQERMVVASRQLRDRILLREKQKREQSELPALGKFLSYRKWLRENDPERVKDLRNWKALQDGQQEEKGEHMDKKVDSENYAMENLQISALGTEQASYNGSSPSKIDIIQ